MNELRYFLLPFCFLLAGCMPFGQAGIDDCDVLTASPLRILMQADTLPSDPVQWITDAFTLDPSAISSSYGEVGSSFNWDIEGTHYNLGVSAGGIPEAIVQFQTAKPTAGQLLECIGPPERYRARYFFHPPGVNSLVFEMYYPSQGLVATYVYQTTNLKRRQPPSITADTPVTRVYVDRVGTSFEEYTRRISALPEAAEIVTRESKPWPGSLDQIEIDLGPFLGSN